MIEKTRLFFLTSSLVFLSRGIGIKKRVIWRKENIEVQGAVLLHGNTVNILRSINLLFSSMFCMESKIVHGGV